MKKPDSMKLMMNRKIWFLSVISIFLVSCLGWILEKPSFILKEIVISPRSLNRMDLVLGIDARNPNRIDLTLQSFVYTFFLNDEEIGTGRLEKEILIPSSSVTGLKVPVTATFKNVGIVLKALMNLNELPYRIEGKAEIKTMLGSRSFTFSKKGRIAL